MNQPADRTWDIFLEVYLALPRQGPGNRASAARALHLCQGLPREPKILDLGCGVGGQTFQIAELTGGSIVAIDSYGPSVDRLNTTARELGLAGRVVGRVGDMASPDIAAGSVDLVWSEGALYNIGIDRALGVCHPLLRQNGCMVFTDAVWRKPDPPDEVAASFREDYPGMTTTAGLVSLIRHSPLQLLGHFTLPDEAWWDDFYTPMEKTIAVLREKYAGDAQALEILDLLAREPEMHRHYADYYAYEFFVLRKV
jgi:SAM-dependent methyltransferase